MGKNIIYLDNAATTKVGKKVVREMEKFYLKDYGNPSSLHEIGERAQRAINDAREKIAGEINCKLHEIIFTSGSTESNNMAFFGLARGELGRKKRKIIVSAIEHPSIFAICEALKKEGFEIKEIGIDKDGLIRTDLLEKEIDENTLLVSIMHVNNEIGVIQDISNIGEICRNKGIILHSDCAQSFGKLEIDVKNMSIDMISAGAHKIGGPKGIGFLYLREGISIKPIIYGGGQERGLRGGTENVPGIVGFAKALELIKDEDKDKIKMIRDFFIFELEKIGGKINGSKENRIYNNIHVSFLGIDGENLLAFLSKKGIYVSAGSACDSKKQKESRVLRAIGLNKDMIKGGIRISLNENISKRDVEYVVNEIKRAVEMLRI